MNSDNLKGNTLLARAEWSAPSNIALIKYWGKKEDQVPANASLSMTLSQSITLTSVQAFKGLKKDGITWDFYFDGKKNSAFEEKLQLFFSRIRGDVELGSDIHLEISSQNSFPHAAGIASSASSMAALSLCLLSLEEQLKRITYTQDEFLKKASRISRLGSGSACRSLYGGFSLWGKTGFIKFSSDKYAIPITNFHQLFNDLQDTILIVDSREKEISSSAGHELMNDHPFANKRFIQAEENLKNLLQCLEEGNWEGFSKLVENEALSLHSMMLTSNPWYILMKPHSLEIIKRIKDFRDKNGVQLTFTLDAGPNIHLLYPPENSASIRDFIKSDLVPFCENGQIIDDQMGLGPVLH